jgi:hypothetical protein
MEKERRVIELEVMDELEDSGVSAIALVDEPAIEKYWVYMRNQKFVEPSSGESQSDFMGRCVPVLIDEGKDQDQAVAVCISMYDQKMGTDTSGLSPYVDQVPKKKKHKFLDPNPCWEGYEAYGLKDDGTPNCIPVKAAAECPEATVNIEVNLANRQKAIDKAMYGPLDIKNPGDYWDKIAARWKVPVEEAKGEKCGNCAAFNITKALKDCIATGIGDSAEEVIEAGDLGFCEFFDFKCNANRSCVAHVDGGPIEDEVEVVASKFRMIEAKFATDNEKQIIVGPAMVPDMEIFRRDEDGEEYYVKFSAETIAKIQQKFMRETRLGATNLDHNETVDGGSYIFESWIVEDPTTDKANTVYNLGVPKNTWMIKMKVINPKVWEAVKAGKYNGFSIEGNFIDKEDLQDIEREKALVDEIVAILNS